MYDNANPPFAVIVFRLNNDLLPFACYCAGSRSEALEWALNAPGKCVCVTIPSMADFNKAIDIANANSDLKLLETLHAFACRPDNQDNASG